jgi:hypothetical protein
MCRDPIVPIVPSEQTHSTNKERNETMFYGGYDYQSGRERMEQARTEIEVNRLEARLAKSARLERADGTRRSAVARGTGFVAALLR